MSLTLTYDEIRREVGRFLGIGSDFSSWSSSEIIDVADVVRRGARRFYFPETIVVEGKPLDHHNWSFIQKQLLISTVVGQQWYDLPSDFIRVSERPIVSNSDYPLEEVSESDIRVLLQTSGFGYPQYYSIKRNTSDPLAYRISLLPLPDSVETISGWYVYQPAEIESGSEPTVPANHSETLLAAILMTADEVWNYETQSEGRQLERFKTLLAQSIEIDKTIGEEHSYQGQADA